MIPGIRLERPWRTRPKPSTPPEQPTEGRPSVGYTSYELDEQVSKRVNEYKDRVRDQLFAAAEKMTLGMAHITNNALLCESAAWEVVRNIAKDTIGIGEFALPKKSISRDRLNAMQTFMDRLSGQLADNPSAWDRQPDGKGVRADLSRCLPLTRDRVIDRLKYSKTTQHGLDKQVLDTFAENMDAVDVSATREQRDKAAKVYEQQVHTRFMNIRRAENELARQQQQALEAVAIQMRREQELRRIQFEAAQATLFELANTRPDLMPRSYIPPVATAMHVGDDRPIARAETKATPTGRIVTKSVAPKPTVAAVPETKASKEPREPIDDADEYEFSREFEELGEPRPEGTLSIEEMKRMLDAGWPEPSARASVSESVDAAVAAAAAKAGVTPSDLPSSVLAVLYAAIDKASAANEKKEANEKKAREKKQTDEKKTRDREQEKKDKEEKTAREKKEAKEEKKAEADRKEARRDREREESKQSREEREAQRKQEQKQRKAELLANEEKRREERKKIDADKAAERKAKEQTREQLRKQKEEKKQAEAKEKQDYKAGVNDPYFLMLLLYDDKLRMLQMWVQNDDWPAIEHTHDFIQVLFPTKTTPTNFNKWLALSDLQVGAIRDNLEIQAKMLKALRAMLQFYGLQLHFEDEKVETPGILVGDSEEEKDRFWRYFVKGGQEQHNWYRIDRIVKSLNTITEGGLRIGNLSKAFDYLKEFLEDRGVLGNYINVYPQWIAALNENPDLVY